MIKDKAKRSCQLVVLWALLLLVLEACTFAGEREKSVLKSNSDNQSANPNGQIETSSTRVSESTQQKPCLKLRRPLNPDSTPQPSETDLDRYFRLAYNAETEGDFDTAITNYQKAAELASCECDRSHAQAGKQAAQEAQELLVTEGNASKPTQYFWGRLQELTRSLSCVTEQ